jgi:hypothetical protein
MQEIFVIAYLVLSLLATLLLWMVLKASKRRTNDYHGMKAESLRYRQFSPPKGSQAISTRHKTALFK